MIYFLPLGNRDIASSRLRVHQIAPYLDIEYSFVFPGKFKERDILVIQKKPRLRELEKAKREGAKVIYDIDELWVEEPSVQQMIEKANVVTTDTEYKKNKYLKEAVVIPDSLDWSGAIKHDYADKIKLLGWTSYGNTTPYFKAVYAKLRSCYDFLIASSPNFFDYFEEDIRVIFYPWSLEDVDKNLAKADAGIIPLFADEFCKCKSMHRLLKFWAIGLPCYVSPTSDYEKAVSEAGADKKCLVTDWSNLPDIEWDEKLREYAFQYHPKNIAKLWSSLLKEMVK
jgi:hypothetical protein